MAQGVLEALAALAALAAQAQATLEEAQEALALALEQAPEDEQALALALGALAQAQATLEQAQTQAVQAAQNVADAAHAMVANVNEVVDAFPQQPAQPGEVHCDICEFPHVPGALVNTTDYQSWCHNCKEYWSITRHVSQAEAGLVCYGPESGCGTVHCFC